LLWLLWLSYRLWVWLPLSLGYKATDSGEIPNHLAPDYTAESRVLSRRKIAFDGKVLLVWAVFFSCESV